MSYILHARHAGRILVVYLYYYLLKKNIIISFIAAFSCLYIYFFYDQLVDRGGVLLSVLIGDNFKLPIEYVDNKTLSKHILNDLEMVDTIDNTNTPIYNILLKPTTELGNKCVYKWSRYFTTNTSFLKDSQKIYKSLNNVPSDNTLVNNMVQSFKTIKSSKIFLDPNLILANAAMKKYNK